MKPDLIGVLKRIEFATDPKTLFGATPDKTYHELSRQVHPDTVHDPKLKDRANSAFIKLSTLYAALNGKGSPVSAVRFGDWIIERPYIGGDIADLYWVTSDKHPVAILKIVRDPRDNDLLQKSVEILNKIHAKDELPELYRSYFPVVLDAFKASGRQALVMTTEDSADLFSLADLMGIFPNGLDFRHIVWMANRALSALSYAHAKGVVHGAIAPCHLMYPPDSQVMPLIKRHGLLLVDWCYAVTGGGHIPAIMPSYRGLYPPEVFTKARANPGMDFYMLAKTLQAAAGTVPKRFQGWFEWCLASPNARPRDAIDLQDKWVALAKEEYGAPKYLPLTIPTT